MSNNFTIILDAGHGGTALNDGSTPNNAVGANGLLEKDLTLKVANLAAEKLARNGYNVLLTRRADQNPSLAERARKSRESSADAFVSIHFNGHRNSDLDGTEVFIAESSDQKDSDLANQLLQRISQTASIPARGVRKTNFTILKGDFHLAKTAACLIEMAYLTNPSQARRLLSEEYLDNLANAVAQSVASYAVQNIYTKSLADESSEKMFAEIAKEHADPKNVPIDFPEPGKGTDTMKISIPNGLKFSRWEVEVTAMSTGAGYKVVQSPKSGAEGNQQIAVDWWHLPYGKIGYKLKVYASPDGKTTAAEKIVFDKAGWMENAKDQISQGVPMQLVVKGEKAKQIYEAIQKYQQTQKSKQAGDIAIAMEPVTITVVILVGIVIFGILVALGLLTLGAVIKMALDKGYNVKDTKYKAGVGEGELKQDHEIAFNIMKPENAAKAQSLAYGLNDDLDSLDFQPLDFTAKSLDTNCGNPQKIKAGEVFKTFKPMVSDTKPNHSQQYDFNVLLRWNDIPQNICEIDVVVHFHGYKMPNAQTLYDVADLSGLDLQDPTGNTSLKRNYPTLCLMPLGKSEPSKLRADRHVFPFFGTTSGLSDLITFALDSLAADNKISSGVLKPRRLILTAHSGGGTAISSILSLYNTNKLTLGKISDINEIHLFDATYGGADEVKKWLKTRIAKDKTLKGNDLAVNFGALRVLYRPCGSDQWLWNAEKESCNTSETETQARFVETEVKRLTASDAALQKRYRVEQTSVKHTDIPNTFGFQLLADVNADVTPAPVKAAAKPACCPDFPSCVCRGKPPAPKQQNFEYEEPDYFADSETSYMNY